VVVGDGDAADSVGGVAVWRGISAAVAAPGSLMREASAAGMVGVGVSVVVDCGVVFSWVFS